MTATSMATKTNTRSPVPHAADSHDLIRVHGARVNNLKDVSVEIPKRRLTVFTGVSGSGKSSLVFGTIAAESQRLINETYSAFVQGFMPTLARPEVDVLEGLTTAIIVDQERMGADARSTVGTATDAGAMLRILFSRLGKPHIGSPQAFSFNVASISGAGAVTFERGGRTTKERRSFSILGGMCPRCEGRGSVNDIDLTQLYDERQVAARGRAHDPRLQHGRLVRPDLHRLRLLRPGQADQEVHQERAPRPALQGADQDQGRRHQPDLRGPDPEDPEVDALQGRRLAAAARPRLRGAGGHLHHLSRVRRHPAQREARSSKIKGTNIADACAMQISDLADWVRGLEEPSVAPLLDALGETLDSFVEIGLGYLSLDRPSGTLSGGEAQRVKMIRQLGSSLTDVTYVFDEPTIGLHPHDIQRMNDLLLRLRDKGNTVLVVEHKPETIAIADHVVDLGPEAPGPTAARWCSRGPSRGCGAATRSPAATSTTGPPSRRRSGPRSEALEVRGASTHNLRDVDVDIPLGVLVVITGVAGSGKSSLIRRLDLRPGRGGVGRPGARSAARDGATRRRTPDCSTRSARRSRRPTA